MTRRVLSVGNCGPDNRAITLMLEEYFSAKVIPVNDLPQTLEQLRDAVDLILVNRVLDRDGSDGLEVIRQIKSASNQPDTPVMMITNFPEHQQRALDAGALEGFGKQALHALKREPSWQPCWADSWPARLPRAGERATTECEDVSPVTHVQGPAYLDATATSVSFP